MARFARIVVPGLPHHVTQRGNRRARIFDDDSSRQAYLGLVRHYAQQHGVRIWAYCLMDNHVHFVVVPQDEKSMAHCFRGAHTRFALGVNHGRQECGHLWQNRFFSTPLDDAHLWTAVRYVEQNPVRAGLVERAEDYAWSSAAAHCGQRSEVLLAHDFPPRDVVADWSQWLRVEDQAGVEFIRRQTNSGRPCGSPSFLASLEALLRRALGPQKRGPKPKQKMAETASLFNS